MTKANSWRGHNTSLPLSPSQALASSPSRTKTKAEEELFVLKLGEKKMPDPEEDPAGPSTQKSAFKPVDSDQFQIGTRSKGDIINRVIAATKAFSADQLLIEIGSAVPKNHLNDALVLTRNAVLSLPSKERGLLLDDQQSCAREFGELTVCGFEKMLWRFLCSPQSAVYKLWLSKDSQISQAETLIDSIIQILGERGFHVSTLLINIMAFILKKPAQAFCERTNEKIRKAKRAPRPEAKK